MSDISKPLSGLSLIINRALFFFLVASIYFVPIRVEGVKKAYILVLFVLAVMGVLLNFRLRKIDFAFISIPYVYCVLSFLISMFFLAENLMELRVVLLLLPPILVGIFIAGFFNRDRLGFSSAIFYIVICGVGLSAICVLQYYNFLGLNGLYYGYLHASRGENYLMSGSQRVLGLYGNPNEVGLVLGVSLGCLIIFRSFFTTKIFLIFSSILFFGILTTASRTAILATFLSVIVLYAFKGGLLGLLKIVSVFVFGIFALMLFLVQVMDLGYLIERATNFDSLYARLEYIWMDAYLVGLNHPYFGHGPARDVFGGGLMPDSKWLSWWIQFGMLGVVFFALYFFVLVGYFSISRKRSEFNCHSYFLGFFISIYFFIYSLVVDFGMPAITPMSLLFMVVLSLALGSRRNRVRPRSAEEKLSQSIKYL